LVVHLFDPKLEMCIPSRATTVGTRPAVHDAMTGQDVSVEVVDREPDPVTQTFSEVWRWSITRDRRVVRTYDDVLRLRWTNRYEMRYLLELTGFKVLNEYSDFKGAPPRYGAEQVWAVEAL